MSRETSVEEPTSGINMLNYKIVRDKLRKFEKRTSQQTIGIKIEVEANEICTVQWQK